MNTQNSKENERTLAMAYIEWQEFDKLYPPDLGIDRGTIFEQLDMPFLGEEGACDDRT